MGAWCAPRRSWPSTASCDDVLFDVPAEEENAGKAARGAADRDRRRLGAARGAPPSSAAEATPVPTRVGWAQTPGHLAPLVAALAKKHPEIMPNQGKTYDFQPVRYPGSTPQIQALAIGDLEVAAFSDSAFALAVTNAHLDVKIVADVLQTGREGYYAGEYVVAKDGPIKTVEDVKGRRVATNAIGSEADSTMRAMLRKHGIQDKDFTTVEANFANQPAMIDSAVKIPQE